MHTYMYLQTVVGQCHIIIIIIILYMHAHADIETFCRVKNGHLFYMNSSISDNRPQKIIGGIFQWVMGNNWNMYS